MIINQFGMEILNRINLSRWIKDNPEPLWTKGQVYGPSWDLSAEYKEWSIAHADWIRNLEKFLGIYNGF